MKIDIERIMLIDALIRKKSTGKPDELAQQLGISRRALFDTLNFMKESLKAPIRYKKEENSYVYQEHGLFCFTYDTKRNKDTADNETRGL